MPDIEDRITELEDKTFDDSPKREKQPETIKDLGDIRAKVSSFIDSAETHYIDNYKDLYNYCDNLYSAKRTKAEGVAAWRANYFIPIPHIAVQEQLPVLVDGLVGDVDFFSIVPKPGREDIGPKAEVWEKLLRGVYEDADIYNKAHESCLWSAKTGWGPMTQGWQEDTKQRYVEKVSKDGKAYASTETETMPGLLIEVISPKRAFPDPAAENKRELEYVPIYCYVTRDVVEGWAGMDGITADLNEFLSHTKHNESAKRYRFYTVFTKREFYWMLADNTDSDKRFLVRRYNNPNEHANIPLYWTTWFPETNQIRGKGLVIALADLTEENNDIHNLEVDNMVLTINKIFMKKRDADIEGDLANIQPGDVWESDDPTNDLVVKELGGMPAATFNKQEQIMSYVQRITGTAAGIMTPQGISTINNQTATGAKILAYSSSMATSMLVKLNRGLCFKPMVEDGAELVEQFGLSNDRWLSKYLTKEDIAIIRSPGKFRNECNVVMRGEAGYVGKKEELERLQIALSIIGTIPQAAQSLDIKMLVGKVLSALNLPQRLVNFDAATQSLNIQDYTPEEQAKLTAIAEANGITVEVMLQQIAAGKPIKKFIAAAQAAAQGGNGGQGQQRI